MVTQIKFLTFEYQFHNEPLRIMLTLANAAGSSSLPVLSQPNNLKTFLRRSRIHESIVQGGNCVYHRIHKRWVVKDPLFESRQEEDDDQDEEEGEQEEEEEEEKSVDDDQDTMEQANHQRTGSPNKGETVGKAQDIWKDIRNDSGIVAAKSTPPTRYNPGNDMFYASMILTSTNGVPSMGRCRSTYFSPFFDFASPF